MSTDRDIAAQPLDDFDSTILDTVAEVFRAADPVPAGLAEDIKFALTVQALHAEVAELQRVGAESALARSEYTQTQTHDLQRRRPCPSWSPCRRSTPTRSGSTAGSRVTTHRCGSRSGPATRTITAEVGRRRPVHRRPGPAGSRALRVPARGRCATGHHAHRGDLRERIRRDLHDHVTRLVEEAVLANAAGTPARAEALLRRALRRLDNEADLSDDAVVLRARVHVTHAVSRVQRGDRDGAFALLDAADGLLVEAPPNHVRSLAVVQRAGLHGRVGEWERTRELLEGVALTAEVAPRTRCLLHLNLGLTYQFLGRYHDSDVRLRRAHQDAVAHGFTDLAVAAIHNRGRLQMLLGNLPRGTVPDDAGPRGGGRRRPSRRVPPRRVPRHGSRPRRGRAGRPGARGPRGGRASRPGGGHRPRRRGSRPRAGSTRTAPSRARRGPAARGPSGAPVRPRVRSGLGGSGVAAAAAGGAAPRSQPEGHGHGAVRPGGRAGPRQRRGGGGGGAGRGGQRPRRAGRRGTRHLARPEVRRAASFPLRLQRTLALAELHAAEGRPDLVRRELRRGAHRLAVEQARHTSIDSRTADALHTRRLRDAHLDLAIATGSPAQVFDATELWRGVSQRLPPTGRLPRRRAGPAHCRRAPTARRGVRRPRPGRVGPPSRRPPALPSAPWRGVTGSSRAAVRRRRRSARSPSPRCGPLLDQARAGLLSLFIHRGPALGGHGDPERREADPGSRRRARRGGRGPAAGRPRHAPSREGDRPRGGHRALDAAHGRVTG